MSIHYPWWPVENNNKISVEYPAVLLNWIHPLHRSRSHAIQSTTSRLRREHFSAGEINQITVSHLLLWLIHTDAKGWNRGLNQIIEDGYLIWLENKIGTWTMMFSKSSLPTPSKMHYTVVYPVKSYITSTHFKI